MTTKDDYYYRHDHHHCHPFIHSFIHSVAYFFHQHCSMSLFACCCFISREVFKLCTFKILNILILYCAVINLLAGNSNHLRLLGSQLLSWYVHVSLSWSAVIFLNTMSSESLSSSAIGTMMILFCDPQYPSLLERYCVCDLFTDLNVVILSGPARTCDAYQIPHNVQSYWVLSVQTSFNDLISICVKFVICIKFRIMFDFSIELNPSIPLSMTLFQYLFSF